MWECRGLGVFNALFPLIFFQQSSLNNDCGFFMGVIIDLPDDRINRYLQIIGVIIDESLIFLMAMLYVS